jgi:hypothetical protein
MAATVVRAEQPPTPQNNLRPGLAAPTFALRGVDDRKQVDLADMRGKPVLLIFGSCT